MHAENSRRPPAENRGREIGESLVEIGGVNLFNSMGDPWTADYLKITGELDVNLPNKIAAEVRAKIVYERLINFTDDQGTIEAPQFLVTRESRESVFQRLDRDR
jgi:Mn-containing catalase